MARFQKSSKETLADLQKENARKVKEEINKFGIINMTIIPDAIAEYIIEVKSDLPPVDVMYWFKKSHAIKHKFDIFVNRVPADVANNKIVSESKSDIDKSKVDTYITTNEAKVNDKTISDTNDKPTSESNTESKVDTYITNTIHPTPLNPYAELIGENGWLIPFTKRVVKHSDFLTGYFLAKILLRLNIEESIVSFHFGCSGQLPMIQGIEEFLGKKASKWQWYGADIKQYKLLSNYLNGINNAGDVSNSGSLRSIRNQLADKLQYKLSFYICDIYPASPKHLYGSAIIALLDVDKKGFSVIRIPDPSEWCGRGILNFILLMCTQYETVRIFKTPWSNKYYLIVLEPKEVFSTQKYTTILKFMDTETDSNLFNNSIMDTDQIRDWLSDFIKTKDKIMNTSVKLTTNEANTLWLEGVLNKHMSNTGPLLKE